MKYYFFIVIILLQLSCKSKGVEGETETDRLKAKAFYFYENDRYDEALPFFTSLISLDSSNGEYYFKRANCYSQSGQKEKAIKDDLRAVGLNYRKDAAFFNIGLDYLFSNDSLARYYFEKCLKENPKHSKAAIMIEQLNRRSSVLLK